MGNINSNNAPIDAAALEAEIAAAKGGAKKGGGSKFVGKSTKGLVVKQKDLPTEQEGKPGSGRVTFRILPAMPDMVMPWVRFDEHFFFNEGNREWAGFNCFWRHSNGQEQCEGCDFIRALNEQINWPMEKMSEEQQKEYLRLNPRFRGAKKMAGSKAKTQIAMNVVFTSWAGGPVPEQYQGVRVFQVGSGIWKGTTKNQVGGLVEILKDNPNLTDPNEGPEICIVKSGVELDTTYPVSVVTVKEKAMIGGKARDVDVPNLIPIAPDEASIQKLLDDRAGLSIFLRMRTHDEAAAAIDKVNTFIDFNASPAKAPAPRQAAPAPQRTAQQDLETEFGTGPGDSDDIPF